MPANYSITKSPNLCTFKIYILRTSRDTINQWFGWMLGLSVLNINITLMLFPSYPDFEAGDT